jgi:hypothetical protein
MYSQYATIFDSSAESAREVDRKGRFIGWFVVCLVIPTMLLAQPAGKKAIVGVWEVKMAPVGQSQSPLLSLAMYGSDGSFTTCGGYKTLPPIPAVQEVATEASPGYGRWAATGDREIRLTFYAVIWKEGHGRYQRVQETLAMSEPGDEYTGHAQVDFLDVNWNVVFSTTSDVKGTKLETPISAMLVGQAAEKNQLEGVWAAKNKSSGVEHTLLDIDIVTADGSWTGSSDKTIDIYGDTGGLRVGRCVATGTREFQQTLYRVQWNKEGVVNQFLRVRITTTLSESGDELTAHSKWEALDPNWTVVWSGTGDTKATRLETPDQD